MSSSQPKVPNDDTHKPERMVTNLLVKVGKQCRNMFRRQKASQAPRPQDSFPRDSRTDNMYAWDGVVETQLENSQITNKGSVQPEDPDTKRTLHRYEKAKQQMKESLDLRRNEWGSFNFTELDTLSEQEELSALLNAIDKVLDSRSQKDSIMNPTKWTKCKKVIANTFTATSPFAKNLLTIAKEAVQIPVLNPYGLLFGGLMLLITVHS
jgi:hypothetical protein